MIKTKDAFYITNLPLSQFIPVVAGKRLMDLLKHAIYSHIKRTDYNIESSVILVKWQYLYIDIVLVSLNF